MSAIASNELNVHNGRRSSKGASWVNTLAAHQEGDQPDAISTDKVTSHGFFFLVMRAGLHDANAQRGEWEGTGKGDETRVVHEWLLRNLMH